jgi:hypothetical protein
MTGDALRPATALSEPLVDRLRAICLALPEAVEKERHRRHTEPRNGVRGRRANGLRAQPGLASPMIAQKGSVLRG